MSRVLFLDIDGVLCTHRTMTIEHSWEWDTVGIRMLNKLLEKYDYQLVLSSTWRYGGNSSMLLRSHGFKNIHKDDATPNIALEKRGVEIKAWLDAHPEIKHYAILDDDSDMLPEQKQFFVQTCGMNGYLIEHHTHLESIMKRANPMAGDTPEDGGTHGG